MREQVASWQVTTHMLAAWGFPVLRTDKMMGTTFVVAEGVSFREALFAAWAAGHVRMAAIPEAVVAERRARILPGFEAQRAEATANLAFLRASGAIVGPGHGSEASGDSC